MAGSLRIHLVLPLLPTHPPLRKEARALSGPVNVSNMFNFSLFSVLYLLACICGSLGSDIVSFTDEKCQKSFTPLDTVNGYPDGLCEPLKIVGNVNAFQIAQLDPGCVGASASTSLSIA